MRLYLELPQSLLSGLFVFRVLQIYTDSGIRMNMHIFGLRDWHVTYKCHFTGNQ